MRTGTFAVARGGFAREPGRVERLGGVELLDEHGAQHAPLLRVAPLDLLPLRLPLLELRLPLLVRLVRVRARVRARARARVRPRVATSHMRKRRGCVPTRMHERERPSYTRPGSLPGEG